MLVLNATSIVVLETMRNLNASTSPCAHPSRSNVLLLCVPKLWYFDRIASSSVRTSRQPPATFSRPATRAGSMVESSRLSDVSFNTMWSRLTSSEMTWKPCGASLHDLYTFQARVATAITSPMLTGRLMYWLVGGREGIVVADLQLGGDQRWKGAMSCNHPKPRTN